MNTLQERFMQLIHSRFGAFAQWATGAIVGYLVALAAKQGFPLSDFVQESITEALTIGFAFLATFVVQWYQSTQNKKVQKALGVEQDGWIGHETVEAAKEL